jgi:hypothetical protein
LIIEGAKATSAAKNRVYKGMTLQTMKVIESRCQVSKRRAQYISKARFEACSDPSMSYAMYLMLQIGTDGLPAQLIWNWDFTQFIYDPSETNLCWKVVSIYKTESTPLCTADNNSLNIAIKYMHFAAADGCCAPMVLMIAIPELKDGDYVVKQVPGLSQYNALGQVGYVLFCSSRAGNDAAFTWFLKEIVIATIVTRKQEEAFEVSLLLIDLWPRMTIVHVVTSICHLRW